MVCISQIRQFSNFGNFLRKFPYSLPPFGNFPEVLVEWKVPFITIFLRSQGGGRGCDASSAFSVCIFGSLETKRLHLNFYCLFFSNYKDTLVTLQAPNQLSSCWLSFQLHGLTPFQSNLSWTSSNTALKIQFSVRFIEIFQDRNCRNGIHFAIHLLLYFFLNWS